MTDEPTPDEVTRVACDLTAITELAADLEDQATHTPGNGTQMPGGDAMAMLGPVANLEAWANLIDHAETSGLDSGHVDDHDPDWEPVIQTLSFWSEAWRLEHDAVTDLRPTIAREAGFLRQVLNWAFEHEPHWADFAADIHAARVRLENTLRAGERVHRGAPCMYERCGGVRLRRKLVSQRRNYGPETSGGRPETDPPETGVEGRRTAHTAYEWTNWWCPNCHREWPDDRYWNNVRAAEERANLEEIEGETWCSIDYAARDVDRSAKTVRTWVNAKTIRQVCVIEGRRTQFVALADVREEHKRAKRRRRVAA